MTTKKETAQPAPATAVPAYRDKRFTSRTLILGEGRTAQVAAGKIAATTDELLALLDQHEDFERIPE